MGLDHVSLQLDIQVDLDPFPIQIVAIALCNWKTHMIENKKEN